MRAGMISVAPGWPAISATTIAMFWTFLYSAASAELAGLSGETTVMCELYGALVYVVMNLVVLPLTRVPRARTPPTIWRSRSTPCWPCCSASA